MMAATLAKGRTILRNAAREPEIVNLAEALNEMGGHIAGAGSPIITIDGVERLRPARITVIPDRIETGTFMVAAAATRGDVRLTRCNPNHIGGVISKLKSTGAQIEIQPEQIRVRGGDAVKSVDIQTLPYPGFQRTCRPSSWR